MNFSVKGAAALAFCLCLVYQQSVEAQLFQRNHASQPKKENIPAKKVPAVKRTIKVQETGKAAQAAASLASYNSFEASSFDDVSADGAESNGAEYYEIDGFSTAPSEGYLDNCSSCASGSTGIMDRPGQFFLVGEYIYARANLSEALAYIVTDSNQPLNGNQFVEFDFDYKSSYRFSGGYRFYDCGGEIVFNYARYRGESEFVTGDTAQTGITLNSPYEIDTPSAGGFLTGQVDIDLKSYDLGFSKTIPLGSPLGCCNSGCDTCCDDTCCSSSSCDTCCGESCGGWCPAWDITWSAGVRFADADWTRSTAAFQSNLSPQDIATTRLQFEGAGARVGALGRRYFGCQGRVSAYAKGDISLLVGNMDIQTTIQDFATSSPPVISHRNFGRRMIPVTEIEAGLTAHLGKHVNLSSGYFLSAWHDLGFRDEYNFGGNFQLSHYDDANILSFDGFFARAEVTY